MPIQLPELGKVSYAELTEELIAAIPKHTREWTNFNFSDPGITLIELLAWVSEGLIYRCDQIPDQQFVDFLQLLTGDQPDQMDPDQEKLWNYLQRIKERIKEHKFPLDRTEMKAMAQAFLSSSYRAVTAADFKSLTLKAAESHNIQRVEVFNLQDRVEIVLIGKTLPPESEKETIIKTVKDYLKPRRLIGTWFSVKLAKYTKLSLKIAFVCKSYAVFQVANVMAVLKTSISSYLDCLIGGPDGTGWPYNRSLSVYELFYVVEQNDDVDHVVQIQYKNDNVWEIFNDENPVIAINGLIELEKVEFDGGT